MLKRAFIAAISTLLLAAPAANAHTALVSSNPKSNAMLTKSPTSISLTFNEDLIKISGKNISKISLSTTTGTLMIPESVISKRTITVKIPALSKGKYKVNYRVVSADGHPVSGSYFFWVH